MASPHGSISTDGQSGPHITGLGQRTITILGVEIEQQLKKLVRDSAVAAFAKHRQEIYLERGDDRLERVAYVALAAFVLGYIIQIFHEDMSDMASTAHTVFVEKLVALVRYGI
jgi:hypothetical protein